MGANSIARIHNLDPQDVRTARNELKKAKLLQQREAPKKEVKILLFDIETSPLIGYFWRRWKENIYLDQTISEWFIISWAAKWLGSDEIMSECLTPEEILKKDDERIVKHLWSVIDQADIVVAHNGERFDVPKINSRFLLAGLPPTSPYRQIDTKKVSAKQFGFSSNKLDALAGYFSIRHKDDTDFSLWKGCMEGDQKSLNYMLEYNKHDVVILEKVYLKLRPWIKNHPNIGLYLEKDEMVCPSCGSKHLEEDGSFYYTTANKYVVMRCTGCGALSRMRNTAYPKDKKKNLTLSI